MDRNVSQIVMLNNLTNWDFLYYLKTKYELIFCKVFFKLLQFFRFESIAPDAAAQTRVKQVTKAVAEHVDAKDSERNG